jgi:hypothetical protein
MKNIFKIVAAAAVAVVLTQAAHAVPITGNIGFSGTANLNSTSANTATEVVSWGTNMVGTAFSGTFASFGSITAGQGVILASPWTFNSGVLNNFWTVGGFTFDLSSSSIFTQAGGLLYVVLTGTVTGNGFSASAFSGSISLQDPSANGQSAFTESLSFGSVPDGATTVLLLGATLSGLALLKRKFNA